MADGLLTSGLNWTDQQKRILYARLGLLMNNPQEFARQLGSEARQRAGVGLFGEPKTAQEMASGAWINSPYGQQAMEAGSGFVGSIKPTSGSKEIDALLNKFSSKAESLKLPIEYGSSNVSGSRYLTFKNPEGMDYQIRISNHGDRYQNQLAGVGERFSIDPESGNTYKDAINWLKEKGINLNKRIKKEPEQTFQQKYNITDEELASLRSRYQNK